MTRRKKLALLLAAVAGSAAGLAMAPSARAGNILTNSGFEACSSGLLTGWTTLDATIICDNTTANSGAWSVKATGTTTAATAMLLSQCVNFSVSSQTQTTLTWAVLRSPTSPIGGFVSAVLSYTGADCTGTQSGSSTTHSGSGIGSWGSANPTFWTIPAGTQSVKVQVGVGCPLSGGCSGELLNIDDVMLDVPGVTAVTFAALSATRSRDGVLVRWRTASELGTLGFHVYRELNGRRVRVNTRLIAAKGRGAYSFLDRRAPRGKALRYWVQEVALDGTRSWYGPIRARAS